MAVSNIKALIPGELQKVWELVLNTENYAAWRSDLSKTEGEDTYTGSYTADYEDFNDKEYIFGGTALERDKGSELTVTYELTVDSGTARLYWLDKGEEKMIVDTSKNGTYSVTLDEGDNYLTLEGNDFCGSLQVVVE